MFDPCGHVAAYPRAAAPGNHAHAVYSRRRGPRRDIGCSGGREADSPCGPRRRGARARWAGAPGPGHDGGDRRRGHARAGATCSSRRAPAPASRSATSCLRCCTTTGSSWPRRHSPCSTSWSSATSRPCSTPRASSSASGRRTPCSRVAPTTPACTACARESPTTRARSSTSPRDRMGAEVLALREWVEEEAKEGGTGERDHAPRHTDRVWRQVSVSHRECLGASRCPYGAECFAERAKERAGALPADRHQPLPARDRRGRGRPDDPGVRRRGDRRGARARLAGDPGSHRRAVRCRRSTAPRAGRSAMSRAPRPTTSGMPGTRCATPSTPSEPGRIDHVPEQLADALALVRDAARALVSAFPKDASSSRGTGRRRRDPGEGLGAGAVQDRRADGGGLGEGRALDRAARTRPQPRRQPYLCVAPLEVAGPMREKLLAEKTAIFTSATLKLGGDFDAVATSFGLSPADRVTTASCSRGQRRTGRQLGGPRRGVAVRLRPAGDPLRRPAPAASGPRRADPGAPRRDHRAGRRRRRPHPRAVLEQAGRRGRCRARPRGAAAPDHAGPGRRPAARAGAPVRRRPAHQPVRHAQPVAGPRRAGGDLPAGDHRPDPVPAPRRPADVRAPAGGRQGRPQRVHDAWRRPMRRCCWRRGRAG